MPMMLRQEDTEGQGTNMKEIKDMYKSLMRRCVEPYMREAVCEEQACGQGCTHNRAFIASFGRSQEDKQCAAPTGDMVWLCRLGSSAAREHFEGPTSPQDCLGSVAGSGRSGVFASGSPLPSVRSPSSKDGKVFHLVPSSPESLVGNSSAHGSGAGPSPVYESTTLAISHHCPTALRRTNWCVTDFDLRALMYNGNISMVYHAVDRRSGITIALKLYKRVKLTAIERHQ
ncbi:protein kinase domain-containing protein, partial [Haematococcus lacustris]